jgi:hypothetical protein
MALAEFMQRVREQPAMILGEPSVSALYYILDGYAMALQDHGLASNADHFVPSGFHDWVAYRAHFNESTSGWKNMLIERFGDGETGFGKFFEFLDDYGTRQRILVAFVDDYERTYRVKGMNDAEVAEFPSRLELATYTNDPGFFIESESNVPLVNNWFYPNFDWAETFLHISPSQWKIVDKVKYERLRAQQDSALGRALARRRE